MAKLPALLSALQVCSRRDLATLDHMSRVVREAGFLPPTKRGVGASEMTSREAANLLIAAAVAYAPKDAAVAVAAFRDLPRRPGNLPLEPVDEQVQPIEAASTFGEALAAAIDNAFALLERGRLYLMQNPHEHDLWDAKNPQVVDVLMHCDISVFISNTWRGAHIDIGGSQEYADVFTIEFGKDGNDEASVGYYGQRVAINYSARADLPALLTLCAAINPLPNGNDYDARGRAFLAAADLSSPKPGFLSDPMEPLHE